MLTLSKWENVCHRSTCLRYVTMSTGEEPGSAQIQTRSKAVFVACGLLGELPVSNFKVPFCELLNRFSPLTKTFGTSCLGTTLSPDCWSPAFHGKLDQLCLLWEVLFSSRVAASINNILSSSGRKTLSGIPFGLTWTVMSHNELPWC